MNSNLHGAVFVLVLVGLPLLFGHASSKLSHVKTLKQIVLKQSIPNSEAENTVVMIQLGAATIGMLIAGGILTVLSLIWR